MIGLLLVAAALQGSGADTLRLPALLQSALARDPRQAQVSLYRAQSELRQRNLRTEWLPSLRVFSQAQHQSDVTTFPGQPGAQPLPTPPHDTYDARLEVRQSLFDPSLGARRAAERAALGEAEARVQVTLFTLRAEVNEAFFTAALLESRTAAITSAITELEAQLGQVRKRVDGGTALPSEAATIEAELLRRRQDEEEARADRGAALAVLAELTGAAVDSSAAVALPDLAADVQQGRANDGTSARPEYRQFDRAVERLARQAAVIAAADRPRLSAFGRAGYGRPGLNLIGNDPDTYWLGGVQLEWSPGIWGSNRRERQALGLQAGILAADEAAFTSSLVRAIQRDLATIDRLERTLATDSTIIALRERIERETRLRFEEGVVTSADYIDRNSDVLAARIAHATHLVELARARARYLTTIGWEVR